MKLIVLQISTVPNTIQIYLYINRNKVMKKQLIFFENEEEILKFILKEKTIEAIESILPTDTSNNLIKSFKTKYFI